MRRNGLLFAIILLVCSAIGLGSNQHRKDLRVCDGFKRRAGYECAGDGDK